jgi:putative membrane protein
VIRRILLTWLIVAVALAVTAWIFSGIEINGGFGSLLIVALVFGLVNALLGPIARLLTFPLIILTLGLFAWVINALLLLLTDWISDRLEVDGFWTALWGALVISIVTSVLDFVLRPEGRRAKR